MLFDVHFPSFSFRLVFKILDPFIEKRTKAEKQFTSRVPEVFAGFRRTYAPYVSDEAFCSFTEVFHPVAVRA